MNEGEMVELVGAAFEHFEPRPAELDTVIADGFELLHLDAAVAELEADSLVSGGRMRATAAADRQLRFRSSDLLLEITVDVHGALVGRIRGCVATHARLIGSTREVSEVDDRGRFLFDAATALRRRIEVLQNDTVVLMTPWFVL